MIVKGVNLITTIIEYDDREIVYSEPMNKDAPIKDYINYLDTMKAAMLRKIKLVNKEDLCQKIRQ